MTQVTTYVALLGKLGVVRVYWLHKAVQSFESAGFEAEIQLASALAVDLY